MKKLLLMLLLLVVNNVFAIVDINSADVKTLESINGIGVVKAQAIVADREKNGPFKSVDDLQRVKGLGTKIIEKIKSELTVGGAHVPAPAPAPSTPPVVVPPPAAPHK